MELRTEKIVKEFMRKSKNANVFTAVSELDFTLEPGKLTEIIGRSGSGKSTLLNMMAGLLEPTSGKVYLDDTDLYALDDNKLSELRNRNIGVIPQVQTGLGSLTVLENILLPLNLFGDTDDEGRAEELMQRFEIAHLADAYPSDLSGGEMRRMAIARSLIRKPSVILADEPTGDLDDENTDIVLKMLKDIAVEGAAVLLVTHESRAREYADRVFRMSSGVLTEDTESV